MFTENVQRGIKWLDQHKKGWRDKINIQQLNLYDIYNCVLGQVFGSYDNGDDYISIIECTYDDIVFRINHGFTIDPDKFDYFEIDKLFKLLTEEWKHQLAAIQ